MARSFLTRQNIWVEKTALTESPCMAADIIHRLFWVDGLLDTDDAVCAIQICATYADAAHLTFLDDLDGGLFVRYVKLFFGFILLFIVVDAVLLSRRLAAIARVGASYCLWSSLLSPLLSLIHI